MQARELLVAAAMACVPVAAQAGSREIIQPIQLGSERVRFDRGDYLVDIPGQHAAMQVRSLPGDRDGTAFMVAIVNTGAEPINVDVGNFRVEGADGPATLLSRNQLVRKAEHRAGWAKALTAIGGALEASSMASQRSYAQATAVTPFGFATASASAPCGSCQMAALFAEQQTDNRIAAIDGALDQTRAALSDQMLQLTTIDPGHGYGGRIVVTHLKHKPMQPLRLVATLNGEEFVFGFRFAPEGTPSPSYHLASQATLAATAPTPAMVTPVAAPVPAALPLVSSGPARSITSRPVSWTPPARNLAAAPAAPSDIRAKWQRYYTALVANGAVRGDAKAMADEQFGPID